MATGTQSRPRSDFRSSLRALSLDKAKAQLLPLVAAGLALETAEQALDASELTYTSGLAKVVVDLRSRSWALEPELLY